MTTRSGARRRTPALLLAFTAAAGSGQPLPVGDEFAVNEVTTGTQNSVAVDAADESAGGAFYFAWRDASGDQDVYLRRYEADGTAGIPAPINQVVTLPQTSPAIDVNDDGEAVVAWRSLAQFGAGSGEDLVFRRSSDDGTTFTDEERGNDSVDFDPAPKISAAIGPELDTTLAWADGGIFYRRFDAAGTPMTGDLTATATPGAADLVVAHGEPARVVLVYSAPDDDETGIYARIVDPLGAELVPEFRVNLDPTDRQFLPAVGVDPAGNFVVAWREQITRHIDLRRFSRFGQPLGGDQFVRDADTTFVGPPAIDVALDGAFVVVWPEGDSFSTEDIFAREYTRTGLPVGEPFLVHEETAGEQDIPDVAVTSQGFLVGWQGPDASGSGVFGRRFVRRSVFAADFETGNFAGWSAVVEPQKVRAELLAELCD